MDQYGHNVLYMLCGSDKWLPAHEIAATFLISHGGAELVNAENYPTLRTDFSPLAAAAKQSNYRAMQLLFDSGLVDVHQTSYGGNTALHEAATTGDEDTVLMILNAGGRFTANAYGRTPVDAANDSSKVPRHFAPWLRQWASLQKLP